MKSPRLAAIAMFLLAVFPAHAQELLPNHSFEGPSRAGYPPAPWKNCGPFSDADTQPGQSGITKPPADGQSYVGLVVRGADQ